MSLTNPEPPPRPNQSRPIWDLVIEDMRERDRAGRAKYGTPLQAHNGRDALTDAYQESLDQSAYLRQEIEERKGRPQVVMSDPERIVILLSGGIDSTVLLSMHADLDVYAMTFRYGQRNAAEINAAFTISGEHRVAEHVAVDLDPKAFRGSSLTSAAPVPKGRKVRRPDSTYVPARNTIFLSYALAYAEVLGASEILIGANADDRAGFPDCRAEYFEAWRALAPLATTNLGIVIRAPLVGMTKEGIIRRGLAEGAPLHLTTSCYDPGRDGKPCRACGACVLRAAAFAANGVGDPAC